MSLKAIITWMVIQVYIPITDLVQLNSCSYLLTMQSDYNPDYNYL